MTTDNRRPPLKNRPWIRGALWDRYSRDTVLHVDAYLMDYLDRPYLLVEYSRGGRVTVALDAYLIHDNKLTPVWATEHVRALGDAMPWRWGQALDIPMARVHARVMALARDAERLGPWSRVSVLAHYVGATDHDTRATPNHYKPRKPYAPRSPDATPRRRGRPRKYLPDWI